MRLVIVTDAWFPQVNGVVRSLKRVVDILSEGGDEVTVIAPERFSTLPMPTYPDIRLSVTTKTRVGRMIEAARPDCIHIATEGPLGFLARRHCLKTGQRFTTSYHTKFPEYVRARAPVPLGALYGMMRWFHNAAAGCMVATPSLEAELTARGFHNLMRWSRGVDSHLFHPRPGADLGLPRPVFLNVGRVAVEKNLAAFTSLDLPGSKVVVGDGPALADLKARHPDVHFLGAMEGEELAHAYAAADVFVFPSLTDTFGNVLLEALASGLPVAAFPVTGPNDVIVEPEIGALSEDLRAAALQCLDLSGEAARAYATRFSWDASVQEFRENLVKAQGPNCQLAA
ncbi:glycosyltransferase family 4 protein [Afifella marina]|uniref:Glycosyltransferase involved in cell wall bisynthesis n=1 Tax=Afifella marina DSM 2698 TaxID=1120955 RepID=A0A1G5N757_AFIMA|nr:glycosyltransferase family 1 protein [Afifella marina]MBK1622523.1 glycosyltransferase family 1 protein [Afifella marina DSM 2698]MBK1626762.1 glycosyltransferase family 1 protein [Afifella marina]MBK5919308.1 alpha-mannosyltransferase [Afifella marina]RAI21342.1 alpha-mannosyltransferase [Afifella marina DSM 2698]SCZ32748.1 Glycosyltransferase involved in cell wall bisynthesis [Afifella marina DSM 2698]